MFREAKLALNNVIRFDRFCLLCLFLLFGSLFFGFIGPSARPSWIVGSAPFQEILPSRCHNTKTLPYQEFLESVLKSKTIYKEFVGTQYDSASWPNDITRIFRSMLAEYLQLFDGKIVRIVEVGSFKGKSAIAMIRICRELVRNTKNCSLIAVDTWLGAGLYYENNDDYALARNEFGSSSLYTAFMNNVIYSNLTDAIVPLRLPSIDGAHVLYCYNITADFIYIDAGHDYSSAFNDIKMYYEVLEEGGYIFGDDYTLRDVYRAVQDFAVKTGTRIRVPERRTWVIRKALKNSTPISV